MGKLVQLREFQYLYQKKEFLEEQSNVENEKYYPLEKQAFEELLEFVNQPSSAQVYPFLKTPKKNQRDEKTIMRVAYKKGYGKVIQAREFVGMIQLKCGYQIEIMPKIHFFSEEESYEKTKKVFLRMLKCLLKIPSLSSGYGSLGEEKLTLYELFISSYLSEVNKLVKRGIKYNYITKEENSTYFKGKLLVNQHIRKNMCHKEKFYVAHDEFHPDRIENQIIKTTLLYLKNKVKTSKNRRMIRHLLLYFDQVSVSDDWKSDFCRIEKSRSMKHYNVLLNWSRVFLSNRSFSVFSGENESYAILFPMETVYEQYVAYYMKKYWWANGIDVRIQDEKYLFEKGMARNVEETDMELSSMFKIRPDIVCEKDGSVVIMDTKWKLLNSIRSMNFNIEQSDVYQMCVYAQRYKAKEVWLLYPYSYTIGREYMYFSKNQDGTSFNLGIYFIDLVNIEKSMQTLKELAFPETSETIG